MKKRLILSVAVVLLVVMVACMCVACTPSEKSITKRFEKEGYSSTVASKDGTTVAVYTKIEGTLGLDSKGCTVTWFENKDDAQKAYDEAMKVGSEKTVAKKGNAVAIGDEASIEIFNKLV